MNAKQLVDALLGRDDAKPPDMALDNPDEDLDHHAKGDPFSAYEYALRKGHHPKLRHAVKGSVYEPVYRHTFGEDRSPTMKVLKQNRKPLDEEERKQVMQGGAVWHHGPGGKPSPAVWKSVVNEKTYYVCNTHRAAQVKPTLKAAIRAFEFIKTTS